MFIEQLRDIVVSLNLLVHRALLACLCVKDLYRIAHQHLIFISIILKNHISFDLRIVKLIKRCVLSNLHNQTLVRSDIRTLDHLLNRALGRLLTGVHHHQGALFLSICQEVAEIIRFCVCLV
jgi:hypothetical protein